MADDDDLILIDDGPDEASKLPPWRILIVDDEPSVSAATRYALSDVTVLGAPLELVAADSAAKARQILDADQNFAVALVDVVMETPDAGLKLVRAIRDELNLQSLRIIIRTGQPGHAPEISVIQQYDINDYRHKADLDRTRLVTSVTAAIRAFKQIEMIEAHRRGLEKVVDATGDLLSNRSLAHFAAGVLTQICALGGPKKDGVVIVKLSSDMHGSSDTGQPRVLAAAGIFAELSGKTLADLPDDQSSLFSRGLDIEPGEIKVEDQHVTLRTRSPRGDDLAIYFETDSRLESVNFALLRVFATKIALGFENVRLHEDLFQAANFEPVTNLLNINGWVPVLESTENAAIGVLRLTDYPFIFGIFGIEAARNYAAAIIERLRERFPEQGQICRLQTDAFGIVLGQNQDSSDITDALSKPVIANGVSYLVRYSLGSSHEAGNGIVNFSNAVAANTLATADSPPVKFTPELLNAAGKRFRMLQELSVPTNSDRVVLHLQPQIQMETGKIISSEALMRWQGLDGRLVPPIEFISLAETSGLIVKYGRMIARLAIEALARLRATGHDLSVSINSSPTEISRLGQADHLASIAQQYGVPTQNITIEITETAFASNLDDSNREIDALIAHGFRLSIDDFGTGHSSLMRLASLPVSEVKLDRSLCSQILSDPRAKAMAKLVLELGNDLGFQVLAEGIETPDQQAMLQELGCPIGQGYLFGRPMPVDQFVDALQHNTA